MDRPRRTNLWRVVKTRGAVRLVLAIAAVAVVVIAGLHAYRSVSQYASGSRPDALPSPIEPRAIPELRFYDGSGKVRAISDYRGKVVLVNVWATWCTPCRKEMPALDRLQQKLGGRDFEVVALSIDRGGAADVRRFYDQIGIRALAIYVDPESEVTGKLKTLGVPTTLLIDRAGRELWRKTGTAEWDAEDVVQSLRLRLRQPTASSPEPAPQKSR